MLRIIWFSSSVILACILSFSTALGSVKKKTQTGTPESKASTKSQNYNINQVDEIYNVDQVTIIKSHHILTEQERIESLFKTKFLSECILFYPSSWVRTDASETDMDGVMITPTGGMFLSKYNFEYSFDTLGLSMIEQLFIGGANIEENEALKIFPRKLYDNVLSYSEKYNGNVIQSYIIDQLGSDNITSDELKKYNVRGSVPFRMKVSYEDGNATESEQADILAVDNKLIAKVVIIPFIDAYPTLTDDKGPVAYKYACASSKEMPLASFQALCKGLIEKSTLSKNFGEECEWGENGKLGIKE